MHPVTELKLFTFLISTLLIVLGIFCWITGSCVSSNREEVKHLLGEVNRLKNKVTALDQGNKILKSKGQRK